MNKTEYRRLEEEFMRIRDERGTHMNTAVRIGTAFLDLLRAALSGEFDEISFNKVLNKPTFLQGLITLGTIVLGDYAEGLKGGIITEEGVAELKDLWVREHAKLGDGQIHRDEAGRVIPALEVKGDSTFSGNLSSPEFVSAFLGGIGWAIQKKEFVNAAGEIEYKYTLEIDNAVIRNTLRVFEMIISQLLGENDNRVFSAMMEVHHYDPETGRVWLSTSNGRWFMNFRKDDCIMVQQYQAENDVVSGGDGYITKSYELLITDVGSGGETDENGDQLDWVTFTNFATQMSDNDGKPYTPEILIKEGDTFTRVDNLTDPDRKGIVTMMTVGNNTPYMDVRYGLKTDPKNNLKSRIGNLEGIRNDIFGWLEGFGIYTTNYYGIGHFINAQTGENVQARQEMTMERFRSFYSETTYNISEEDNFLKNGFFQKELESWQRCDTDGTAVADEPDNLLLGVVETSGGDALPLMINGQLLSTSNHRVVEITDVDGIKVLHLMGMGVSQSFSDITERGKHDEVDPVDVSSTETEEVDDDMFMGIRILPLTRGTLSVKFKKANGSWTGWDTELDESFDWYMMQAGDRAGNRWDWTGTGSMVLSYTGECYIRFVALTTDAVANTRAQFTTEIEQTSRRITLEAARTDALHNTAMAQIQLQYNAVMDVVTTNKSTSDTMLATILGITVNEDGTYSIPESLLGENMATWRINTNSTIIDIAAHWDEHDKLIGYATQEVTWNHISSEVASGKTEANKYTDALKALIDSDVLSDGTNGYATFKSQTSRQLNELAGKWNGNELIGYSTRTQTADFIREVIAGTATSAAFSEWGTAGTGLINGFKDFKDGWDDALSDGKIDAEERGQLKSLLKTLETQYNSAIEEWNKAEESVFIKDLNPKQENVRKTLAHKKNALGTAFRNFKEALSNDESTGLLDLNREITRQDLVDAGFETKYFAFDTALSEFYSALQGALNAVSADLMTRVTNVTTQFETYQTNLDNKIKENYPDSTFLSWVSDTMVSSVRIKALLDENGNLTDYSTKTQTADAISQAVVGLASSSSLEGIQDSLNNIDEVLIPGLRSDVDKAKESADTSATWIQQNSSVLTTLSGRFNEDGTLKNVAGLVTGNGTFAELFSAAVEGNSGLNKASMGTYVEKDGDNYITGAYIDAARVDFRANLVQVYNQDGDITFQLDQDGNLKVMGTIEGGKIINDIKVGQYGAKVEIYCDERSSDYYAYHSGIRGWDNNGNKVFDLGYHEYGTNKLQASLNIGGGFYRGDSFQIGSTYNLDVGFNAGKIYIRAPYDAWPVTSNPSASGVAKGTVYVDSDGFLKVMNA